MFPDLALYVGGQWLAQASGGWHEVLNPATGAVLGRLPLAGAAELDAAAQSAQRGFEVWRRHTPMQRADVLRGAAQRMRECAAQAAAVLSLEQGKPLAEAAREWGLSADILDFQADEGRRVYGRTVAPRVPGVLQHQVLRQPVGPVAAFTPWNFPAQLPVRKLAGALAAGCSMVLKPAEETPATAQRIVQCLLAAGLPPEAVNLVCGVPAQVSQALIAHPAIEMVSFTGSVAVGRLLGEQAARELKRYSAELGGHAPVLLAPDVDPIALLPQLVQAKFRNAGQVCASPIRFYVPRAALPAFADGFAAAAQALRSGPGSDPATQMGPLTHARRVQDMQRFVDEAVAAGARCLCGGAALPGPGFFYPPTVLVDLAAGARVLREEPFGPLALLLPYDTLDDAIAQANDSPYALGAYAFTRDLGHAHRLAEELQAGMVGINHFGVSQAELPFGGFKRSGQGHEMGPEGLLEHTHLKTVTLGAPP